MSVSAIVSGSYWYANCIDARLHKMLVYSVMFLSMRIMTLQILLFTITNFLMNNS